VGALLLSSLLTLTFIHRQAFVACVSRSCTTQQQQ